MFDLTAYLDRIGIHRPGEPTGFALSELHRAHVAAIPFENIDVRLGRRIDLDIASLERKLVRARRGGYCFEQNTLFATALRALGFEVATLEARVRPLGADGPLPRTHMVLRVMADGQPYLADVGFGGSGPIYPVLLDGTPSEQPGGVYAVRMEERGVLVLHLEWRGEGRDLYAFSLEPVLPVDYEVANHFTSTHPTSSFVTTLTVQRSELGGRYILRGRDYTTRIGDAETTRQITEAELPALLRDGFGLQVTDEEALLALG